MPNLDLKPDQAPVDAAHQLVDTGQDYLPAEAAITWFRRDHPEWSIETELLREEAITLGKEETRQAIFRCTISGPDDGTGALIPLSVAHGSQTRKEFAAYIEKAETKSINRAMENLGYSLMMLRQLGYQLGAGEKSTVVKEEQRAAAAQNATNKSGQTNRPQPVANGPKDKAVAAAEARDAFVHKAIESIKTAEKPIEQISLMITSCAGNKGQMLALVEAVASFKDVRLASHLARSLSAMEDVEEEVKGAANKSLGTIANGGRASA